MGIVGDWDVTIKTPVGSLQVVYSFAERDGVLTGSAAGKHETVELTDIVVDVDGGTAGQLAADGHQTDATQPRLRGLGRRRPIHRAFARRPVTSLGGLRRTPPLRGLRRS